MKRAEDENIRRWKVVEGLGVQKTQLMTRPHAERLAILREMRKGALLKFHPDKGGTRAEWDYWRGKRFDKCGAVLSLTTTPIPTSGAFNVPHKTSDFLCKFRARNQISWVFLIFELKEGPWSMFG